MVRLLAVVNLLSVVIVLFALAMLVPLGVSLAYGDAAQPAYGKAVLITLATGGVLWIATRGHREELQPRDGFLLVALVWSVLPVFGTLPFLIHFPAISFTDAYFEAVSGLTASGATVFTGLDALPRSINIWRGFMVWIGGMGIIVLAVAILPLLGVGGSQLFKAETPGPMKDTKLTPRITETAKGLWLVYVSLTVACALCYRAAGMSWFDAAMHAFTTMGLGGFSSYDASFAHFDSAGVEAVAIVFMLIAGMNFASHFLAFRRRGLGPYARDPEVGAYLGVVAASSWSASRFSCGQTTCTRASGRRCATLPSTSCRSQPPPAIRIPTTTSGRSSRRSGCCSCAASRPAPARPAAASR